MLRARGKLNSLFLALAVIIVVLGAVLWFSDLVSDPPMYFSGYSQSLHTDPALYVYHARNHELFGRFDPFQDDKWSSFQYTLVSGVATVWFAAFGVSMESSNLIGLFLSLSALIFFTLGLYRFHRPWVITLFALCYVINVTLLTHGRLPYLENGLLLLLSALFWVYSWWGDRLIGLAISGALIAIAMICGKLFGVLILPALLAAIWFTSDSDRMKRIALTLMSFAAMTALLALVLYSGRLTAITGFLEEKTVGLYGFPPGLTSPVAFIEHLIDYGYYNHLFYLSPDLVGFLVIGGYFFARFLSIKNSRFSTLSRPTILAVFAVVCFTFGLMPLAYSPVRYALPLIPFIIILCFTIVDTSMDLRPASPTRWSIGSTLILGYVSWVFFFHLIANFYYVNTLPDVWQPLTWYVLPAAVAVALIVPRIALRNSATWDRPVLASLVIFAAVTSIVVNGFRIHRYHYAEQNTNTIEANRDLTMILNHDAVVAGPYGPALTLETPLKSFIYFSGVQKVDTGLFNRQPLTHFATDEATWEQMTVIYPQLKELSPIADYWICDNHVFLYRISQSFRNPQALTYRPTDYEQAASLFARGKSDSALAAIEQFHSERPHSKMGELMYVQLLSQTHQNQKAFDTYQQLAARYPTDWSLRLGCGHFAEVIAVAAQDQSLLTLAESYFKRAVELNPFEANYARKRWIETLRLARK
jgi:hypothetical protein